MGMRTEKRSRKAIKVIHSIINLFVLIIVLLLLAFSGYALWDSDQIYQAADKANYAIYKPTPANQGKPFQELQALNPEVFAWLSVYGTNIDYPVTQGPDNMKYVNTNAEGLYSLSGAIFLDSGNSKDFSDFNSILYGHHMEKKAMFGEIDTFSDKNIFDSHRYGNLYFDGADHGIEFFAFLHTDAYDYAVFTPGVKEEERQAYLHDLLAKATYQRDIGISTQDCLILLSTCSSSSTNGRDILVGRITGEVYSNPFIKTETNDGKEQAGVDGRGGFLQGHSLWLPALMVLIAALLIILIFVIHHRRKQHHATRVSYKRARKG